MRTLLYNNINMMLFHECFLKCTFLNNLSRVTFGYIAATTDEWPLCRLAAVGLLGMLATV